MSEEKNRLEKFLQSSRKTLINVMDDSEIRNPLSVTGYDSDRIKYGQNLCEEAQKLFERHKTDYEAQIKLAEEVEKAWDKAVNIYIRSLKIVRIICDESTGTNKILKLNNERCRTLFGWIEQAESFYSALIKNPWLAAEMSRFGYSSSRFDSEYSLVKDVSNKLIKQKKLMLTAMESRIKMDQKLNELDIWMAGFRKVSVKALKDKPDKLEKLGIKKPKKNNQK